MSITELERRLVDLERTVEDLKSIVGQGGEASVPWWKSGAGRFRHDPDFEEITRLGAEYRRSLGTLSGGHDVENRP